MVLCRWIRPICKDKSADYFREIGATPLIWAMTSMSSATAGKSKVAKVEMVGLASSRLGRSSSTWYLQRR